MENLLLLETTTEQGLPAVVSYLQKQLQKEFMIIDHQGKYHYASNCFIENKDIHTLFTTMNSKEQTVYTEEKKTLISRIGNHEVYLFVVVKPVAKDELNQVSSLLDSTRLSLSFCLNTIVEAQMKFSKIENDLMEMLFVRKSENSNDFLPFGHFNLNSDKPYVIQLIHVDQINDPININDVIDHLVEYTEKNNLPSMRAIFWQNNLVHIIPALYKSETFELREEWPEIRVSEIFRKSAEQKFNIKVSIGIGQVYPLCELYKSYTEARIALIFKHLMSNTGYVQRFKDLGVFRYIFSQDMQITKNHVLRSLGPILDYDNQKHSDLLSTLRILVTNGFNWKDTAVKCNVHVNTIYYRVERIEKLLTIDLTDEDAKFNLFVVLKLWDVLNTLGIIDDAYVGSIGSFYT
jgi:hypothetical protein